MTNKHSRITRPSVCYLCAVWNELRMNAIVKQYALDVIIFYAGHYGTILHSPKTILKTIPVIFVVGCQCHLHYRKKHQGLFILFFGVQCNWCGCRLVAALHAIARKRGKSHDPQKRESFTDVLRAMPYNF